MNESLVLALDLGGTQFRVALVTGQGEIVQRVAHEVDRPDDPAAMMEAIGRAIEGLLSGVVRDRLLGMGIAVAGLVVPETGTLLTSPNLPEWYDTPLKRIWEDRLGLPVWVGNDASLGALGEWMYGAGKDVDDIIYITVSTGVGGGFVSGGRLLTGSQGFAAEIGHMTIDINGERCRCGNVGCLETLASGTAIARIASERLRNGERSTLADASGGTHDAVTSRLVGEAAAAGDRLALEIMEEAATNLGVGIVNLVHLLNPALVVIGGGVANTGDLLFGPVRRVIGERSMKDFQVKVVPAQLGDDPGILGAVALVVQNASSASGAR